MPAAENEFTAAGFFRPLALAQVALFDSLHITDLEVNHLLFSCKSFALLPGFPP